MYELILINVQLKEFKNAIEDDFFFEMFVDDLPMWGYVGEVFIQLLGPLLFRYW